MKTVYDVITHWERGAPEVKTYDSEEVAQAALKARQAAIWHSEAFAVLKKREVEDNE